MAIRRILEAPDELLFKKCKEVEKIDAKILSLLEDMAETMHNASGVGLAAPQVGILKRIAVIDIGEGVIELINPELAATDGDTLEQLEGCLSYPGKYGYVERPQFATVKATDRNGENFTVTGEGLLARALVHEIEHLDGHTFVERVSKFEEVEQN